MSLYKKFALVILIMGLLPMAVLFPFLFMNSIRQNTAAIRNNYQQMAEHIASSAEDTILIYDNISRIMYQYNGETTSDAMYVNYENYDNLRNLIEQDTNEGTRAQVLSFLRTVANSDSSITEVHLLVDNEDLGQRDYHYEVNGYFYDLDALKTAVSYDTLDRTSRNLILIPPHDNTYSSNGGTVFTVARNYFDLRGSVGHEKYVGTLFIDIDVSRMRAIFHTTDMADGACYILDAENQCFGSTDGNLLGFDLEAVQDEYENSDLFFTSADNQYGLSAMVRIPKASAYAALHSFLLLSFWMVLIVIGVLLVSTFVLSKSLTKPLSDMSEQMKRVEKGDFDISLPVTSRDEIGTLAKNFNEMSRQLKIYINQSYVAKIRQNEAELTALKSQIYPHFLYNTLDVIRMTALEDGNPRVATMIESLAEQIHYLIGPTEDTVPLSKEIDIIRKYVFLLNCRIEGKVDLSVQTEEAGKAFIPRLTLQPIVENAYVHGIRPKTGSGSILIDAERDGGDLLITVMDNGVGMNEETLQNLKNLLEGDQPGIRNQYDWQSIGLKNVQDRLKLQYGEQYGLVVTSTEGVGTSVEIRMPYMDSETDGRGNHSNAEDDTGRR